MRRKWKKLLSTTLALAMVITTIGVREVPVSAAEEEDTNESVVYMDDMAYDTTTGHFYKLSSVGTYEQVNAEAKESGGYLACISSAEENEIVAKVSSTGKTTTSSYIGLMRNKENIQEWMWADGSEVNYTNWNEGEPNSENETVAEIYDSTRSSGAEKWNDCTVSSRNTGVIEYNECIHPESQYVVKNKTFADCEQGGYTGDTYCGFCDEKIADGKETEPGGHAEAVIDEKTVKEATCTEDGYTGDKICPTCKKVLEHGKTTPANGHTESEELRKVREASCYLDGYTGEIYCTVCGETLEAGDAITKLEHKYEDNVCKNCGRINNAQLDTTYTSKTTNLYPFQVIQFKAPENGKYKFYCENITVWDSYGYLFKEENFNDQVIIDGIEKFNAIIGNNTGGNSILKGYWKINDDDGANSAPEITAELEKDKIYYFVVGPYSTDTGEFSITITCTHEKTHREGRTLSDCTEGGYTGDVICDTCGKLVEQGQTLEPGEHTVEVVDAREANCYIEGKTGEEKCSVCDKVLKENKVIPKLEHKYENDICKNCGRIENAKKGTEYSSHITKGIPIQVIEYTAQETEKILFECNNTKYWYNIGYLFDETNYSDEMLEEELEKYYSGDTDRIILKNYLTKNESGGGKGAPAVKYKVQKDKKYYLVIVPYDDNYGEFTVKIDCPHDRTHIENETIKTCSEGGYTGDVICDLCGKVVKHGENIEPDSEHNYINYKSIEPTCNEYGKRYLKCVNCGNEKVLEDEDYGYADHRYVLVNSVKATCTTDGYLGDSKCKYCGLENENQPENKVIKAYHDMDPEEIDSCLIKDYKSVEATCEKEGYTGDVYCTICHKVIKEGKTIEKLEHSFKDGKCMECGADEEVVKSEKDGYYEISTFDQLITYLKNVESGISGKLINDIEFPENYDDEDDVIGRKTLKNSTFDGNGHKISGINSNGTQTKLFDDIYVSEIKDLEIECKEKEGGRGLGVYLANSTIDSKFTNCSITGNRIEIDGYCSAMIREAYASEFIHCINNADIIYNNDTQIVAGLVCEAENCIFDKCENNGNIATTKAYVVGGIIAQAKNCIIKDCINRGDITTYGYTAGIVAGVTNTDNRPCTTSITGCTNEGKVESIAKGNHTYTAGICIIYNGSNGSTYADELIINNCVNNGEIEGDTVAGIIGNSSGNLKLSDCENNGAINGRYSAGGIAQCIENKNSNEAEVSNCINNGNVFGGEEAAGIIDYAEGITVTNCINNGNISSNGYVGGIFSYTSSVKGTGLVNNGKISGLEDIGGISAYDEGNSIFSKLYNTGVIDEENIGAQVSNLVKLGESSTGEELEEEHKHDYVALSTVTKATTEKDGYIESYDSTAIYYRTYRIPQAKAAIVISHGFCEFAEKYKEVIYYFLKNGYSVYVPEHRGHGYSDRIVVDARPCARRCPRIPGPRGSYPRRGRL